jgi:hypothetical protein
LESYARLKEANVAALVAESFEELMIVTCNLRNEDSKIDWYLIQVKANEHDEFSFHHVSRPAIDIQTQKSNIEYSEFWEPVRKSGLFAGKPIPIKDEGWLSKSIRGVDLCLQTQQRSCSITLYFKGDDRIVRRDKVAELFPPTEYNFEIGESPKFAKIYFPVIEKGKENRDDWPEIRDKLVQFGEGIYKKIQSSDV